MTPFTADEMRVFVQAMCAVAWADGVVQDEEREILGEFVDMAEAEQNLAADVERWLLSPVDPSTIQWGTLSEDSRAFVYRSAVRVVMADGNVDPGESAFLRTMVSEMDLASATVDEIHTSEELLTQSR